MTAPLETDYLVIGSGIAGLNFAGGLLISSSDPCLVERLRDLPLSFFTDAQLQLEGAMEALLLALGLRVVGLAVLLRDVELA